VAQLLKLEAIGYRNTQGRFAQRTDKLAQAQREEMRDLGRVGVSVLRHYAPKRTGKFAEGLAYRTDTRARSTTLTFYARGEHAFLLPMLTGGTAPHPIYPHGDYPLSFFWPRGPEGAKVYHYMHVNHPGTIPDPFVANALDALSPQLEMSLARVARRVAWLS